MVNTSISMSNMETAFGFLFCCFTSVLLSNLRPPHPDEPEFVLERRTVMGYNFLT